MTFTVRPITEDERPEFRRLMGLVFGFDPPDEGLEPFKAILEIDRTVSAFDGDQMIGTAGAFSLDMTVPGGRAAVAGTTMVSVLATHRRRGVLRQMMRAHFDEARVRGDALAALWASESSIYGRFGFGPAATRVDAEIERSHAVLPGPPHGSGAVRLVDPTEARILLPAVFEKSRLMRPGMFDRSEAWWEHRVFRDPESRRGGATSYRYAVYEEDGIPRGYVQYRAKEDWDADDLPNGEIRINDLQAVDLAAADGLWRYLGSIDLIRRIKYWNLPADEPLRWLLADPRRLHRRITDSLWVCPIDVPAALATRTYSRDGTLVIEVHDDFNTSIGGTYLLEANGDEVSCVRSTSVPQIRLSASDLGAIYLGGVRLLTLAAAGRIEGPGPDLKLADAMFSWHPAPWCQEVF
jgi:predicted acetyltransferase